MARYFYASPSGSTGSLAGTSTSTLSSRSDADSRATTFCQALKNANADGDTIILMRGTYYNAYKEVSGGAATVNSCIVKKKNLTVKPYIESGTKDVVTFDGGSLTTDYQRANGIALVWGSGVEGFAIEDVTIKNYEAGLIITAKNSRVSRVKFYDMRQYSNRATPGNKGQAIKIGRVYGYGVNDTNADNAIVEDCLVDGTDYAGFNLDYAPYNHVLRNKVLNVNELGNGAANNNSSTAGIKIQHSAYAEAIGNEVDEAQASVGIWIDLDSHHSKVLANKCRDAATGIQVEISDNTVVMFNRSINNGKGLAIQSCSYVTAQYNTLIDNKVSLYVQCREDRYNDPHPLGYDEGASLTTGHDFRFNAMRAKAVANFQYLACGDNSGVVDSARPMFAKFDYNAYVETSTILGYAGDPAPYQWPSDAAANNYINRNSWADMRAYFVSKSLTWDANSFTTTAFSFKSGTGWSDYWCPDLAASPVSPLINAAPLAETLALDMRAKVLDEIVTGMSGSPTGIVQHLTANGKYNEIGAIQINGSGSPT